MRPGPAQIKIAIAKPCLLTGIGIGIHLQRQRVRRRLHVKAFDADLDMSGWQRGVDGLVASFQHRASDRHNGFKPRCLDRGKAWVGRINDALCQPVMITKIDKNKLAVITLPVDPARQANRLADIGLGKLAACM